VEGFAVEKEAVRIHLKGAQEVVVEPPKTDRDTSKFRQYLIEKRDRSRQRELRFIHHYLDIYEHDNRQIIATLQQQDIADPPQPPHPQGDPDTRAEIKEES
jgi:hypothetical protein